MDATPYLTYLNTVSGLIKNMVQTEMTVRPRAYSELLPYWEFSQEIMSPLKILVAGEFKTGKSTFINSLLKKRILKSDVTPATAVITNICYGTDDRVMVLLKDKSRWTYPLSELPFLTSEGNTAYADIRNNIEQVSIYLQNDFLQYLTIVDSPGINVIYDRHVEVTESVFSKVDFVIWLMSATQPAKKGEIERIRKLQPHLRPVVVVNGMDTIDSEEDNAKTIINAVRNKVGAYARDVYGISAIMALEAYEDNNVEQLIKSGFAEINKLVDNLCNNWFLHKYESVNARLMNFKGDPFYERIKSAIRCYYPSALVE